MITFSILIWLFFLLLCDVLNLSNLQITLELCLLLNFYTKCTLCCKKYFAWVGGWSIISPFILSFFYVLYCNITSFTSPKITLVLCLLLGFCKKNLFLPWEIVVWPNLTNRTVCYGLVYEKVSYSVILYSGFYYFPISSLREWIRSTMFTSVTYRQYSLDIGINLFYIHTGTYSRISDDNL